MTLRRSLYARPEIIRGEQCAEAHLVRWCHPAAVWSRRWSGLLGSVPVSVLLSCPGCGSTRWRLTGGACGRRPAVGRRYWPGVPGRRPCRPSPARVHRWVSTHPIPTAGVRSSNRPVSSRPMSSCPVSSQLVPSSGVQPSGRLVSVRPVPFSSVAARRWPWDHLGGGQPCDRDGSSCRWSAGPERLGRGPESAWRGRCCGGRPVGERRSRTWPGRARAQAATVLDRWPAGRPAWREGRRSLPASGRGWHLAWGMTTLRGRCGA
jgi:hypothetical protein